MSDSSPIRLLIRKLENFGELTREEKVALYESAGPLRTYGTHEDLIREGEHAQSVSVIASGFACRHKMLPTAGARSSATSCRVTCAMRVCSSSRRWITPSVR
jgi:hypothetical protein